MIQTFSEGILVSEKSVVTSSPLKECIEIENGIRPSLYFTIDDQFQPGKLIYLFRVFCFAECIEGKVYPAVTHYVGGR